jgi:hypothetical protein
MEPCTNTKFGNFSLGIIYMYRVQRREKNYTSQKEGNKRFLTTCSKEDVGVVLLYLMVNN